MIKFLETYLYKAFGYALNKIKSGAMRFKSYLKPKMKVIKKQYYYKNSRVNYLKETGKNCSVFFTSI